MVKISVTGKRRARKLALQSLYQWLMSGTDLIEIEAQFRAVNNMDKVDQAYFSKLLHGVPGNLAQIEAAISPFLDRPIDGLNPIELTILRLSTFELFYCLEIPYRVVLDESVSLAKEFGSQDGHRYVNGILHHVAKKVRNVETSVDLRDHSID